MSHAKDLGIQYCMVHLSKFVASVLIRSHIHTSQLRTDTHNDSCQAGTVSDGCTGRT